MAKPAPKSTAAKPPVEGQFAADCTAGYTATRILENGDTVVVAYKPAAIASGVATVSSVEISINRKGILTEVKNVGKTDDAVDLYVAGNAKEARVTNFANTSAKKAKTQPFAGDVLMAVVESAYKTPVLTEQEADVLSAIASGRISIGAIREQMNGKVFPEQGFYTLARALNPTATPAAPSVATGEPEVLGGKLK